MVKKIQTEKIFITQFSVALINWALAILNITKILGSSKTKLNKKRHRACHICNIDA